MGKTSSVKKNNLIRRAAGKIKREIDNAKISRQIVAEEKKGFEAFRSSEIEKYVFDPEKRGKYKTLYKKHLKKEGVTLSPKTVNDYYFDNKVQKNTILISGLGRSVRGSMQYLLNELNSNEDYKDFSIYVRTSKETDKLVREYISQNGWVRTQAIDKGLSEKLETCEFLVTESYLPYSWVKRPEQIMVDLWHGTPLKSLGVLKNGKKAHKAAIQQKNFLSATYLMYPNEFTREVMWKSYQITSITKAKTLMLGYPRTSGILQIDDKTIKDIKRQLAPNGEHIYAYMPTFRGYLSDAEAVARETQLLDYLDEHLRDDQILYVNLHHHIKEGLSCENYKHIKTFPPLIDSYSLLAATEALISDYSSVFFDYLILRRQIILYIEDLDTYRSFQGLNLRIEDLPFDLARSRDQIIEMLNRGKTYDDSKIYESICAHDSKDNPEIFCRLFLSDETDMDISEMPGNEKRKVLLYSEGLVPGRDTETLSQIVQTYSGEDLEIRIGCDEYKTGDNTDSAYPLLHNTMVLASRDSNPLSSVAAPVLDMYKKGKMSFYRAMKFLHYEYHLVTKRLYGDAELDIIGIYDTVNPEMVLGMALSDTETKILFVSDKMKAELERENTFFRDAFNFAAAYCSHVVIKDEKERAAIESVIQKRDYGKIIIAHDAESIISLLERK